MARIARKKPNSPVAADDLALETGNGGPPARDGRKALVEQQILEHASHLFAQKGYAGTSLRDIADSIGLTRGAVYYYFKNKEAMLEALIQDMTLNPARDIERWRSGAKGSPRERLHEFIRMRTLNVLHRGVKLRILEMTETALPPELLRRHIAAKRQILSEYAGLIREGVVAGEFRPVDERIAAFAIIGMVNWTAWWFVPDHGRSAEEIADQIAEMATQSLLNDQQRRQRQGDTAGALDILRDDLDYLAALLKAQSRAPEKKRTRSPT